jgi:hypothetical protein
MTMTTVDVDVTKQKNTPKQKSAPRANGTPTGLVEGGKLYKLDPRKAVIGGLDEAIAVTDPCYDERADLSDEELKIDSLADSLDASNEDVIVDGIARDGRVFILKGRRRTRGSRKVWDRREKHGKPTPNFYVVIRSGDADALATAAFVENFNRLDDPPLRAAQKYQRHMESRGWDVKHIAALTGQVPNSVKNTLSLLKLIKPLQNAVDLGPDKGGIGPTVGYELARLSEEKQKIAFEELKAAAEKNGGKIRKIDATMAVARAQGKDPEEALDEDEDAPEEDGGGGKKKGKAKAKETAGGPKYEPITPSMLRRFVKAVEKGDIDKDDEDLKQLLQVDALTLIKVLCGEKHRSQAAGLSRCLQWSGVKFKS